MKRCIKKLFDGIYERRNYYENTPDDDDDWFDEQSTYGCEE